MIKSDFTSSVKNFSGNTNFLNSIKLQLPKIILAVIILVIVLVAVNAVRNMVSGKGGSLDNRVAIAGPIKTANLNKSFNFPVKDSSGKVITQLTYTIDSAELRNEIAVQGQRLVAIKGKTYLILSIEIKNDFTKSISVNATNFIRLSLNGDQSKWLAPDIHNDPVDVAAQSTKLTRLGFFINDTDSKLVLKVGDESEATGSMQLVPINFK